MGRRTLLLCSLLVGCHTPHEPAAAISAATTDAAGIRTHVVRSPRQAGETRIRVLVPDHLRPGEQLPVLYVLPVEAGTESRYGDGLREIRKRDLHNQHRVICVAPSFSHLPWYANHPTDLSRHQESYLLGDVLPFVERAYPVKRGGQHRMLMGFSKSGWGAFALALRHPHMFGAAAAWDAPMMMDRPGRYGSGPGFGGMPNFRKYQVSRLIENLGTSRHPSPRLVLTGYHDGFRAHHIALHRLMEKHRVPHIYRDGPARKHRWDSGWVAESIELLLR